MYAYDTGAARQELLTHAAAQLATELLQQADIVAKLQQQLDTHVCSIRGAEAALLDGLKEASSLRPRTLVA
jgi:hypothetical protein